jgi:biotin transport system substrate-specific component
MNPTHEPSGATFSPRRVFLLLVGAAAVAVGSRWSIPMPGTFIPQSAQTLAVLLVGAGLGSVNGGLAILVYLAAGALGLPVFADGGRGWTHLVGPTAGYLVGFVCAAVVVGLAVERKVGHRALALLLVMLSAHAIILGMGWMRLSWVLGVSRAFETGVSPFVLGGVVKAALAAAATLVFVKMRALRGAGSAS